MSLSQVITVFGSVMWKLANEQYTFQYYYSEPTQVFIYIIYESTQGQPEVQSIMILHMEKRRDVGWNDGLAVLAVMQDVPSGTISHECSFPSAFVAM